MYSWIVNIYYYGTIVVYYIIVCRLRAWSGPSYEIKIYFDLGIVCVVF